MEECCKQGQAVGATNTDPAHWELYDLRKFAITSSIHMNKDVTVDVNDILLDAEQMYKFLISGKLLEEDQ